LRDGLPDVSSSDRGSMNPDNRGSVGDSNGGGVGHGGNWDSDLGFNWLTVLLGNPLSHGVTVNSLLQVASGDWHGLGNLLWSVDTDLLGHLAAVRLDSSVGSGHCSWGSVAHQGWCGSMGHIGGSNSMTIKSTMAI